MARASYIWSDTAVLHRARLLVLPNYQLPHGYHMSNDAYFIGTAELQTLIL
jgi:hypothetical protein